LKTQNQMILAHLYSLDATGNRRGITAMEALGLYQICSLSSRISELQRKHNIISVRKVAPNGKTYHRYWLASA
jgi:hypothetical protein